MRLLEGRRIAVTGASRGLGAAVAEACAREGAALVLIARTRGALEEVDDRVRAAGGAATLVTLDLREGDKIDALGGALFQRFGHIDGLVHAAATLGSLTPVAHLEPKAMEELVAVNLIAAQRLIRAFDPLLRAAPAGRAVFVTDRVAEEAPAYWGGYAATKAAMAVLVRCWAKELAITSVKVELFEPGPMATRLRGEAFPGELPGTMPAPEKVAPRILPLLATAETGPGENIRLLT